MVPPRDGLWITYGAALALRNIFRDLRAIRRFMDIVKAGTGLALNADKSAVIHFTRRSHCWPTTSSRSASPAPPPNCPHWSPPCWRRRRSKSPGPGVSLRRRTPCRRKSRPKFRRWAIERRLRTSGGWHGPAGLEFCVA